MNAIRWCALATLVLAGCGGCDDAAGGGDATSAVASADSATPPAPSSSAPRLPDSAMAGAQAVASAVMMNEVGGSGITGQAQFMESGQGQTMVTVTLNGQGNGPRSGHIHQGTCDSPGPVVAPLQDVALANGTGSSSTTIEVPLTTVMNGQLIVAYHAGSGADAGAPAVCGAIPAQSGAM